MKVNHPQEFKRIFFQKYFLTVFYDPYISSSFIKRFYKPLDFSPIFTNKTIKNPATFDFDVLQNQEVLVFLDEIGLKSWFAGGPLRPGSLGVNLQTHYL